MICKPCADAAAASRKLLNRQGVSKAKHPRNCGCPCMHKVAEKWEKQFSVPEPVRKARKIEDTKPL
jgi:hypothetical protein